MAHPISAPCLLALALFTLTPVALAGFEEGLAAYQRGDYTLAFEEFTKGAAEGDERTFGKIGGMYLYGRGVAKDYIQAYAWLNLAETAGDRAARQFRDAIAEQMSTEQIYASEKLFTDYLERYLPEKAQEAQ